MMSGIARADETPRQHGQLRSISLTAVLSPTPFRYPPGACYAPQPALEACVSQLPVKLRIHRVRYHTLPATHRSPPRSSRTSLASPPCRAATRAQTRDSRNSQPRSLVLGRMWQGCRFVGHLKQPRRTRTTLASRAKREDVVAVHLLRIGNHAGGTEHECLHLAYLIGLGLRVKVPVPIMHTSQHHARLGMQDRAPPGCALLTEYRVRGTHCQSGLQWLFSRMRWPSGEYLSPSNTRPRISRVFLALAFC
jgi:hypothetical protein